MRVEELVYVRADLDPGVSDGVAVDRARLAKEALRFRTLALMPGRARLVDTWSAARYTEEICIGGRVMVCETGRARALLEVSRGGSVVGAWLEGSRHVQACAIKLIVEVERVSRHWEGTVSNEER
jgi:hypothetical protein